MTILKTIKQVIKEVSAPISPDEKRFRDKHVVLKTKDANGNGDDVFNATNITPVERTPKHGYNPGEDEKVYEEVEKVFEGKSYHKMSLDDLERARQDNEEKIKTKGRVTNNDPLMNKRRLLNLHILIKKKQQNNSVSEENHFNESPINPFDRYGYGIGYANKRPRPGQPPNLAPLAQNAAYEKDRIPLAKAVKQARDGEYKAPLEDRPTNTSSAPTSASVVSTRGISTPKLPTPTPTPPVSKAPTPTSTYKGTAGSQELAKLNNIKDVNRINVGQKLNLGSGRYYTVKPGDTLDKIARSNSARSEREKRASLYQPRNPDVLTMGENKSYRMDTSIESPSEKTQPVECPHCAAVVGARLTGKYHPPQQDRECPQCGGSLENADTPQGKTKRAERAYRAAFTGPKWT